MQGWGITSTYPFLRVPTHFLSWATLPDAQRLHCSRLTAQAAYGMPRMSLDSGPQPVLQPLELSPWIWSLYTVANPCSPSPPRKQNPKQNQKLAYDHVIPNLGVYLRWNSMKLIFASLDHITIKRYNICFENANLFQLNQYTRKYLCIIFPSHFLLISFTRKLGNIGNCTKKQRNTQCT